MIPTINIYEDQVWMAADNPHIINWNIHIHSGAVLTLEAGVIMKLLDAGITVEGSLIINGEENQPVVITSNNDNSYGGDTNPYSNSAPHSYDWEGIRVKSGGKLAANHAIIQYSGDETGAISVEGGEVEINNSTLTKNNIAMAVYSGTAKINNSKIFGNFLGGIDNESADQLDATNNWWGDNSGPYHETLNPQGKGEVITGDVLFDPWTGKEKKKDPVIIVPGIMGSWYSSEKGWELDPFLHTYDNLYKALVENGEYIPEKTLFKFPYEWRQDNKLSAYQLKEKINEVKSICQCDKVDIIAHSMGGLVARYYIENDDYQDDIDQIVFLGTPHKGAPKAYYIWEGAEMSDSKTISSFIEKKYFEYEAHTGGYKNLFDYIRDYVKSVEQLLPAYPYLRNFGEIQFRAYDKINYPGNYPYNNFLENLNSEDKINNLENGGINIFNIIGDTGDNTINAIEVSSGQEYSPLWEHGYPKKAIKLTGDGTVPEVSSSIFMSTKINNADHSALPTNAQKQIINYLTDNMPVYDITETPEVKKALVVGVFSPVDFVIVSPDGKKLGKDFIRSSNVNEINNAFYSGFNNETEFAIIPDPLEGEYKIELQGTGEGEYKLSASYVDDEQDLDKEFTGHIQTGQTQSFDFFYSAEAETPIGDLIPEDNTAPIIEILKPNANGQYLHNNKLIIDYSVADDFSGIASTSLNIDGQISATTTIDLFYYDLGAHAIEVNTTDNAGNYASATTSFEIITTISGSIADIERINSLGWIKKKSAAKDLITGLRILQIRLNIFQKEKALIENLKQETIDNQHLNEKAKQKLIKVFEKRLENLERQENNYIHQQLGLLEKSINKYLKQKMINRQGYGIIINDINYLNENL